MQLHLLNAFQFIVILICLDSEVIFLKRVFWYMREYFESSFFRRG